MRPTVAAPPRWDQNNMGPISESLPQHHGGRAIPLGRPLRALKLRGDGGRRGGDGAVHPDDGTFPYNRGGRRMGGLGEGPVASCRRTRLLRRPDGRGGYPFRHLSALRPWNHSGFSLEPTSCPSTCPSGGVTPSMAHSARSMCSRAFCSSDRTTVGSRRADSYCRASLLRATASSAILLNLVLNSAR